jgi:hypothetical protein
MRRQSGAGSRVSKCFLISSQGSPSGIVRLPAKGEAMKCKCLAGLMLAVLFAAAASASAGSWSTQATLANNAYNGTVALDASGRLNSVWYQNAAPNGTAINQIWASTSTVGGSWSAPVDISGTIDVASGNPSVRGSASGNVTAIYTDPTIGTAYVDKPAGGAWKSPLATNGVNQFYVSNDNGDEGLAWGTGGARPTSSTVVAIRRPAGGVWSAPATIAAAPHLSFDGAIVAPDGSMAVAWESFDSVCGSRTCTTSNWVLHVSTLAAGAQTWVDSGALLGPDSKQHFGQLAADSAGDLGVLSIRNGYIVSVVRHGSAWSAPVNVVSTSTFQYYTGTGHDNRIFASDSAGHATIVGWGNPQLSNLATIDGNLATNTWGSATTISGPDQQPGYFDFAMSSSGAAIAFYPLLLPSGTTTWRAITRPGAGKPWNAPATAGSSFEGGGTPDGVAVNSAGQAAVVFHGYSSDYTTNILYSNTYKP